MDAIVSEDLVKIYDGKIKALSGVSLKIRTGLIFSLLGRNGAGKTTFLRIMATQLMPTSGKGYVLGYDVISEARKVREKIAVIPQESRPLYLLTVKEHVKYYLMMRGVPSIEASRRASEIIQELELNDYSNTLCMKLSGGLRRKVLVAMAMATGADILFLDEPTTGLDPISRRLVWDVIKKAASSGQTVFLTTHYLDEAEKISDEVALINEGRLIASGKVHELKSSSPHKLKVEINTDSVNIESLREYGRVVRIGRRVWVYVDSEEKARRIYDYCIAEKIQVTFSPISLEDLFVEIVRENECS
ncbi:MAG: ABC transporter ATP-binding protein [Aigarchaeota archaeon]|nr:ABC transporter ATP-binding protein [Aigarchaeota archaeon]